jgi:hypothetical protein
MIRPIQSPIAAQPRPDPVAPVQRIGGSGGQPIRPIAPTGVVGPALGTLGKSGTGNFGLGSRLDGPGQMRPEMPVYHKGTDYVPKTGPAILKKGEAVLNPADAKTYRTSKDGMADSSSKKSIMGATSKSLAGKSKAPSKQVREIRIRKGASGGHVIEHHHSKPDVHPMEEHTTANDAALLNHIQQTMGNQDAQGAQPADPNAAAAAGGAADPSAMAGAGAAPSAGPSPAGPAPTPGM